MTVKFFSILFFQFYFTFSIYAGNIKGKVVSESGLSIENANILIEDSLAKVIAKGTSDKNGVFCFENLINEKIILRISVVGYKPLNIAVNQSYGNVDLDNQIMLELPVELKEVTVESKSVIQKPECELYLPTSLQRKIAQNGLELLRNISVRGIYVNPIDLSVKKISSSGVVQMRINNIRASAQQIMSLRPEKIMRIEYNDNITGKNSDEGVDAIINYITKKSESGGTIYADVSSALTTGFSNDNASFSFNTKSSEININYFLGIRKYSNCKQDGEDVFNFPNQIPINRTLEGIYQPYQYFQHVILGSYQLQKTDNYMLNIQFSSEIVHNHADNRLWMEHISNKNSIYKTSTLTSNPYNKPILDIYFEKIITKNRKIIFDVLGTFWNDDYLYKFQQTDNGLNYLNFQRNIDGNKKSVIADASYLDNMGTKGNINIGIRHTQSNTNNQYNGNIVALTDINLAKSYLYTTYSNQIKKIGINFEFGVTRTNFEQSKKKYTYYNFKPSAIIKWDINENQNLSGRFRVLDYYPSLGQLSNVSYSIDNIQIKQGNPDLKPYSAYSNSLLYSFTKSKVSYNAEFSYIYQNNPIMESFHIADDMLVNSFRNQKNWNEKKIESQIAFHEIGKILDISVGGGYQSQQSNGMDYSHRLNSFYAFSTVSASYKGFSVSANMKTKIKRLYGESYSNLSPDITIQTQYLSNNKWLIGLNIWNPFMSALINKFETKSNLTNQYKIINYKDNGNLVSVRFAYFFKLGRQFLTVDKKINNSDSDSGIPK